MVKKPRWEVLLLLVSLLTCTSCQRAESQETQAISARSLVEEYENSTRAVRSKYDGKEIIVRGRAVAGASMPRLVGEQGSVALADKEDVPARQVTCWFSSEQADYFSKLKGGQYITVKGIFTGEAGVELKFCKLVKTESD
jgi:tRNA_anti-like